MSSLYNKMILDGLTLGEVYEFVRKNYDCGILVLCDPNHSFWDGFSLGRPYYVPYCISFDIFVSEGKMLVTERETETEDGEATGKYIGDGDEPLSFSFDLSAKVKINENGYVEASPLEGNPDEFLELWFQRSPDIDVMYELENPRKRRKNVHQG